jgi:hypothetical protein
MLPLELDNVESPAEEPACVPLADPLCAPGASSPGAGWSGASGTPAATWVIVHDLPEVLAWFQSPCNLGGFTDAKTRSMLA